MTADFARLLDALAREGRAKDLMDLAEIAAIRRKLPG